MIENNPKNSLPSLSHESEVLDFIDIKKIQISEKYATNLKKIFYDNSVKINGKNYVKISGWLAIANLASVKIQIKNLEFLTDGILAYCEILSKDDKLLTTQYGFAGYDEISFGKRNRNKFEFISLAQTRAVARALKNIFGFILSYYSDFETTNFEDLPADMIYSQKSNENFKKSYLNKKEIKFDNDDNVFNNFETFLNFIKMHSKEYIKYYLKINNDKLESFKKKLSAEELNQLRNVWKEIYANNNNS